jgi:hypothetical protein
MQIDETDADELLREMARGVLTRQRQDEEVAFGAFRAHVETEIAAEEASWAARVARREAAAAALLARRQAHMSDASKSEFVTAAEFGCCIQGKYVLMTIEAAVSALAGCVPSAACVRLNAYNPLDCSTTSVEVLGVDLLKMLAVDVKGDNRYPGVPPIHGSPEEKSQWESHQEMFTMYVDEDSEDLRVRACHWVHGDQGIPNSDSASRAQSLRCTYEDVSDYGTLPLTERMRLAKLARAFWCDYYGRLPIWQSVVHRLAWQREVDQNTGKTVVGSVSLKFECPASIGAPRFERETAMHEQKMRNLTNKLRSQESLMIDKREHMEEHLREAAEKILTPEFKQQALMRLVALMPAPEFDEDDVDNPAAQWADQLVATLVGGDNYIGEGQSSVRGRDEAEEWAAAQEAAREEARLKLANDTLSYVVCGEQARFGQVPGVSIAGYMDVVTLDFRRDAERSSTNSVLVTICTALENALLCPMLGGYDTIVEVADSAPEEPVGGPITTLVPPSSCRQATTALNKRLPHTCIIFNDSEAPLDHFIESNYTGHRRNEPPRHEERGFARYSLQRLLVPDPIVPPNSFGVTERAAVANSAGCWPRRHTWHSEEVANGNLSRVRRQSDYAYVSERKFASGSNDPNIYVAHMDTYKVGQLEMRKLSWFLRDERTRIERAKKEEEDAAMQARIEAGKQMAAQREADRLEMERQSHYAELRAKKRRRGKGKGQGSEADDWKARRNRSEMVGVCDTAGGDLWFAFLDKTVGAKDGGGTIFYHSDKLEERNGVGSSWDRPVDWEGVVGGPDMMKKVHDYLVATGQRAPDADAPALSKEEQEAQLSEQRLAKIEAEKKRRVDEAIREKQEHYVAVVSRVRRFIDERARLPGDRYDLRRPFDNFDADGQGSIDKEEFTQVLELLFVGEEIDFWPDEVDRLMAVFDDTQDGFITFGKFVRFAMGENPNVDTGLPEPENLIANGDDALGIRIRKLLEKIYEWTEDFDPATDRKYWYNPASASSVYEEPESLGAAVKALEAEKALIDSQRREKTANEKQRKAEAKAEKHMKQLPKTMGEFVQKLAGNSEFVDMLAKQLGLEKKVDPEVKRKQKEKDAQNKSKGKRAALDRERRRLEGMGVEFGDTDSTYSGEGGDGEEKDPDASSDSDLSDDDEDGAIAAEKRRQALLRPRDDTLSRQAELERRKLAWRRMKPANVKKNFVTAATSCKVAKAPASLCKANTPSVCGIVDPAEAIVHVQPPQLIPPRVDFVEDVMASSDRLRALADGGEDAMAASEKKSGGSRSHGGEYSQNVFVRAQRRFRGCRHNARRGRGCKRQGREWEHATAYCRAAGPQENRQAVVTKRR